MEATRLDVHSESSRCPFCHERVSVESEEWVACRQCLARHHRACWSEHGKCSSCQGTVVLEEARVAPPVAPFVPGGDVRAGDVLGAVAPTGDDEQDRNRRETSLLLEEADRKQVWVRDVLLAVVTLGLHPVIAAELAFRKHRAENAPSLAGPIATVAPDVATKIEEARAGAIGSGFDLGAVRAMLLGLGAALCLLVAIVVAAAGKDEALFTVAYIAGHAMLAGNLHLFRESVRGHEHKQFYARLVGDAVPPSHAKEIVAKTAAQWGQRRAADVAISLLAFIPMLNLVLVPLLLLRLRGALSEHEQHEASLPRTTPRPQK